MCPLKANNLLSTQKLNAAIQVPKRAFAIIFATDCFFVKFLDGIFLEQLKIV